MSDLALKQKFTLSRIQKITGGMWVTEPEDDSLELIGGAFDTRDLRDAEIFFAWKGENSDGHLYTGQLENTSIRLIIAEQKIEPVPGVAILKVTNSLSALHQLASVKAGEFSGKIISVTGSSGKTTTKTWLNHVLSKKFSVLCNPGSFNNHIGCPITTLFLKPEHELLLLEMGTSGIGELELLSSIAPADITVLLNVGHAHLGHFGSLENTRKAKLEIFRFQRTDAVSYLPQSDVDLSLPESQNPRRFGEDAEEFGWKLVTIDPLNGTQDFSYRQPDQTEKTITIPALGPHVGDTFSLIFSIGHSLGMSWEEMSDTLAELPTEKGRMVFEKGSRGQLILDDTYNANPESLVNMLKSLSQLEAEQRIAVIGNLAELESDLRNSADVILQGIPENLTHLFITGETGKILAPLIEKRFPGIEVMYLSSLQDLTVPLLELMNTNTVVGVKGSRSAHMERIVKYLQNQVSRCWLNRCGKMMACINCSEF